MVVPGDSYHDNYHPFFPIAHKDIFYDTNVARWAREESHLLNAILTVASKDEEKWRHVHEMCLRQMESKISQLIWASPTTVGTVEALLILAEWAVQPRQEKSKVGCGKEDSSAWMLVGLAVRIGYLQKLEQTGLSRGSGTNTEYTSRQRIAWAGKSNQPVGSREMNVN